MQMRVHERDCPATGGRRDHIAEVTLTGTAIARFSPAGQCPALTVMPLSPQRRQAARARYSRHQPGKIATDHRSSPKVSSHFMLAPSYYPGVKRRAPNPASVEAQTLDVGPGRGSAVTGGGRRWRSAWVVRVYRRT